MEPRSLLPRRQNRQLIARDLTILRDASRRQLRAELSVADHGSLTRRELAMTTPQFDSERAHSTPLGPFLNDLKVEPVSFEHGRAVWRLRVSDQHLRTHGILHGGVVATLLDTALGRAVATVCQSDQDVVTAQLNVNFVRPVWSGETLLASGEVQHHGRQTAVARGEIRTADDTLVATGSGTFLFVPRAQPGQPLFVKK
jgi:acyl-CoA thioesterase